MTRAFIIGGAIFFWLLGTFAVGCMVYTLLDLGGFHYPAKGFVACVPSGMVLFFGLLAVVIVEWEKERPA